MACGNLRAQPTNANSLQNRADSGPPNLGGPFVWCGCLTSAGGAMMTHRHLGADKVVRGETLQARDDINITPLVDVLLVLLVIFMVALPLTEKALDTKLPPTSAPPGQATSD